MEDTQINCLWSSHVGEVSPEERGGEANYRRKLGVSPYVTHMWRGPFHLSESPLVHPSYELPERSLKNPPRPLRRWKPSVALLSPQQPFPRCATASSIPPTVSSSPALHGSTPQRSTLHINTEKALRIFQIKKYICLTSGLLFFSSAFNHHNALFPQLSFVHPKVLVWSTLEWLTYWIRHPNAH